MIIIQKNRMTSDNNMMSLARYLKFQNLRQLTLYLIRRNVGGQGPEDVNQWRVETNRKSCQERSYDKLIIEIISMYSKRLSSYKTS